MDESVDFESRMEFFEPKRCESNVAPGARPGAVLAFAYSCQGMAVFFLPIALAILSSREGGGIWRMLLSTMIFAPAMFIGQLIIWLVTAMQARRAGVRALGRPTFCSLLTYYGCVILYLLSVGGTGGAVGRSSFLMRMGVSGEVNDFCAELTPLAGSIMLFVTIMISLVDRPKAFPR